MNAFWLESPSYVCLDALSLLTKLHTLLVELLNGLEDLRISTNEPLSLERLKLTLMRCRSSLHKAHKVKVLTYAALPTICRNPKSKTQQRRERDKFNKRTLALLYNKKEESNASTEDSQA
jgi:hypothetical protein